MQTITMNSADAHEFDTFEDAEAVASQWQGAEVQQVTFQGMMPSPRTVFMVHVPVPAEGYRMGYVTMRGYAVV